MIIELDDFRPIWLTGQAECSCGKRFATVYPGGAKDFSGFLECPACGKLEPVDDCLFRGKVVKKIEGGQGR